MNEETYGEIINGEETYHDISVQLKLGGNMLIGWTDEEGTHFDILFAYKVSFSGNNFQGGIRPATDLFVSIMRKGAFAFDVENENTHYGYYAEKLFLGDDISSKKLGELINGIKKELISKE